MQRLPFLKSRLSGPFWALCLLLGLAFLIGGGAREDIQSLMVLRPAACLLLGYGLMRLRWEQVRANAFLFSMAAAIIGLVLVQLVPLPPALWSQLPGRELVAEVDRLAGLGAVWRPISLVPSATWNAFYALLVPLAVLVLGVRLRDDERFKLLPVVVGLGVLSAVIGMLQILGDPKGALYFYEITNNGSAVGLFANRNHQALLLAWLFPMLAVWASAGQERKDAGRGKLRLIIAILIGLFLVPLVLITGSRSGMIAALIALLSMPLVIRGHRGANRYGQPASISSPQAKILSSRTGLPVLLGVVLVLVTIWLGRAVAYERLMVTGPADELRLKLVPSLLQAIGTYFPFGSGAGSFEAVYQMHEPRALLSSIYMNHAHNDWLELLLTEGVAGLVLLLVACVAVLLQAARIFFGGSENGQSLLFARLGIVMILLAGLASLSDYPLRVPSLACLFVLAALWASGAPTRPSQKPPEP